MSDHDQDGIDPGLTALYRANARETPSPAADQAVLAAAAAEVRRRRHFPWLALAATLLLAVMLAPLLRDRPAAPSAQAVDAYLLQVQAPPAPADAIDAYLLRAPSPEAGL